MVCCFVYVTKMSNSLINNCLNFKIFESGAKMNIYILSGLGLIFSFWTQGLIVRIYEINPTSRFADDVFILTILKTYIIVYSTTTVALVWGLHIAELRYVMLWGFVKFIELIFNFASFIGCFVFYRSMPEYVPIIVVVQALGIYVIMSVWKLYKNHPEISGSDITEEKNEFILPNNVSTEVPPVHKTVIN